MTGCVAPGCKLAARGGRFCERHANAPAAQRGGWISAARRRPYDATTISPRLWIGGKPPTDVDLPGVDLLVLAAEEVQPDHLAYQGRVLRCPIPDAELSAAQARSATQAAVAVARAIAHGERVLVTCHLGRNRSALIVALALHQLTTMSADQIVAHIRNLRGHRALSNASFVALIQQIVGDGRPKSRRSAPQG